MAAWAKIVKSTILDCHADLITTCGLMLRRMPEKQVTTPSIRRNSTLAASYSLPKLGGFSVQTVWNFDEHYATSGLMQASPMCYAETAGP